MSICSCGHPEDVHSFEYGCNTEDLRATPCGCTGFHLLEGEAS